jgi:hypothetical protein
MDKFTRRGFLKFLGAGAAIAAMPISLAEAAAEKLPLIMGDGIHNDLPGFIAAMQGLPFVARNECVKVTYGSGGRRTVTLAAGRFNTTQSA